ncbi:MAG: DUF1847 domain-containing protein [Spirochaetales bacterium]|uniref:DUF1847 domain-containing protein n=1 Tax=Candidatus Thalassospirochaeta sargassi TaxID=3119039 RepID=A0AAJ1MKJ0_9SPIO|nr:DUF1847 domain-containing protein [Spirochaetales bacterium]
MNCLNCTNKNCKLNAKDCNGSHDEVVAAYKESGAVPLYENADKLVAGGRAGSLSRVDEIIEFAELQGYSTVGIAYCFSMEKEAVRLKELLDETGLKVLSFRCTVNGVKETEISDKLTGGVNCNPIGQARAVNASRADLVIEMGLCLGHDILFHQHLEKPFTVLAVKDRVHGHNPLKALS